MPLACWGYSTEAQRPHTLLKIVDVMACLPYCIVVSGALCGLDGEKAEAPSTPHTITGMGSERPLWFSSTV
jgi:hypothetical protein